MSKQLTLLLAPLKTEQKRLIVVASVFLLVGTLFEVAGPYFIKHYIDEVLTVNDASKTLLVMSTVYIGLTLGAALFRYGQSIAFANIALNTIASIRKQVFRHVIKLPTSWHDQAISGQTLSRITNDTESLKELYVDFVATMISNSVLIIGILIGMALLDVTLMLIALVMIPIVIAMVMLYQHISGPAVDLVREKRAEQNVHISEAISGMNVLQSMNQVDRYQKRFSDINDEQYRARMLQIKASGLLLRPAMDLISTAILAGVILIFGLQTLGGEAQIGTLYGFILYLGRFSEPLIEITQRVSIFQSSMVAGKRIQDLLNEPLNESPTTDATIQNADIQIQELSFSYNDDKTVLNQVSVDIPRGKFLALVGRTGSGKSTFLNLLLGHYPTDKQAILVDGTPLLRINEKQRAHMIGLVPQEPFIKHGTLKDNITMDREISDSQIEQAVNDSQLRQLVNQLPHGLDTLLGEGGANLSSGQKQLVAMARALAGQPAVLILDEATANLDSETEALIQAALNKLKGQVSLIVVAHRLSTIREADEILVLSHGHIIERGPHKALMAIADGYYAKLNLYQQEERALSDIEESVS